MTEGPGARPDGTPEEAWETEVDADRAELGRLIVVSGPMGPDCHRLAWAMARHLDESVVLDGPILAAMVASEHASGADEIGTIRTALLRYCGEIALAETYRRAGYDVLVVEDLQTARLADFRHLSDPDDIHVVVLDGSEENYPGGLHIQSAEDWSAVATEVLTRLTESLMVAGGGHDAEPPADPDAG